MTVNRTLMKQLAHDYNTTLQTIYCIHGRVKVNCPPARRSGGLRRVITWKIEQAIKHLLDEMPWYYQDEIKDFLLDAFDIDVCQQTISMALKRIKVTKKKLKVEAAQRNQELRSQWQYELQDFTAEQLVCMDESGSDNRTGDRQYG